MGKTMKAMGGMKKTMRAMAKKKRAMKKSSIAKGKRAKSSVFRGTKAKTASGLQKSDLTKNKNGRVVSRKQSARGKAVFKKNGLDKWAAAVKKARKDLNIKGWCSVGGKTQKGKALLAKTRSYYKKK